MSNTNQIKLSRCVRYYDDIQYGCESEEEAHKILALFENSLREFELELNPDKVHMISGPHHIESPWLFQLRNFEWQNNIKTDLLMEIISFVAEMAQKYPEDQVFRFFLGKMRTTIVADDAWTAYQRILLSLLQENRGNAKVVFEQLSYYQRIGFSINKKTLKEALDRKVQHQLSRGVTSELSWAIYGYLFFDIQISKTLAKKTLQKGDAASKAIVTKIIFKRNMALKSDVNTIVRSWGEDILNSSEWLFAYEVLVNRWHNRYLSVPLPTNAALYEHLRDERVSFLDEESLTGPSLPVAFRGRQPTPPEPDDNITGTEPDIIALDDIEDDSTDEDIDEHIDETSFY